MRVDGKSIIDWKGDRRRLTLPPNLQQLVQPGLYLGCFGGPVKFHELRLSIPTTLGKTVAVAPPATKPIGPLPANVDAIDAADTAEYVKALTDAHRAHIFDVIMQYRAGVHSGLFV